MHTVDFHAHPVPAAFRQWMQPLGIDVIADDGFPLPKWSAQEHLKFMDDAGIDYSVLSLPTPHIYHGSDALSLQAAVEINDELCAISADHPADIDAYDVILLGYPNWWASIPMPIATFLESYDFSGKTILPFCSHGGGRFGQSLTAIAKLAPQAIIAPGLSVHYSGGSSLSGDIHAWLESLGVLSNP